MTLPADRLSNLGGGEGRFYCCSWNLDLTLRRAEALGGEFKTKGVNILLGPVVGPLGRVVPGGRNWEGIPISLFSNWLLVAYC